MANQINQFALWGARYAVDGATWTPGEFAGDYLVDAAGTRFLILTNTDTTLSLQSLVPPNVGQWATLTAPGWVAGQYASTPQIQSQLVDTVGTKTTILQSTADTIVYTEGVNLTGLPYILQGGVRIDLPSGPTSTGTGWWQIVDAAGALQTDSLTETGDVTATAGGESLPVTDPQFSQVIDLDGIDSFSLTSAVPGGTSPAGVLSVLVNDSPAPQGGAQPGYIGPGPSQLDPFWKAIKVSVDGAAASASVTVASATAHVVVPSAHPNSVHLRARWLMLQWVPDGSPGTGNLSVPLYGYGAKG